MMEWHWYIAHPNEIFVDIDGPMGGPCRRLILALARLRGAVSEGKLLIQDHRTYRSFSPYHYHLMIQTQIDYPDEVRLLWESHLCDDSFRRDMNHARLITTGRTWSLLISPAMRRYRPPDHVCRCEGGKHRGSVMDACPVARKLGPQVVLSHDFFGGRIHSDQPIMIEKMWI